jgi:hypothetical protein
VLVQSFFVTCAYNDQGSRKWQPGFGRSFYLLLGFLTFWVFHDRAIQRKKFSLTSCSVSNNHLCSDLTMSPSSVSYHEIPYGNPGSGVNIAIWMCFITSGLTVVVKILTKIPDTHHVLKFNHYRLNVSLCLAAIVSASIHDHGQKLNLSTLGIGSLWPYIHRTETHLHKCSSVFLHKPKVFSFFDRVLKIVN